MSIKIKLFLLLAASVTAIVLNTFLPMVMADIPTNLSLYIAAISLVLVAVFSFSAYKAIVPPLQLITAEINNITQNKDLSHSLQISGHNEIDKLSTGINAMLDSLKDFISNTVNTTSEIASASEKLSVVTEDTRRGVNRQQSESEQVATAMNEMTATVQEVARNAGDAAEASHVADDAAATGREVVNQAISGIKQLAQEVENTARVLDTLQQESNNIGAVLNVIQGIAEQTNLLALNAAIEAARAGETGRGFAVVADEVRSLAQRSQESTAEIQAIIERLQSGSEAAVKAMNIGLEQAQLSVEQADRAGQSLDTIANAVNAINDMNAMIASAAEEQSAVAEEINRNIVNIVNVAEETAHGANETTETTRQLATVAMKLQGIVGHYQLGSEHKALDLSKAKSAHRAWKARLRSFLDGKEALTTQEAVSHKHCILGKWYYSEGLQNFGHLKSMQDIEPPHAEMHALIKEIIELKQQGDEAAAEEIFKEIGPLSEKIVSLLDQVEHQAISE